MTDEQERFPNAHTLSGALQIAQEQIVRAKTDADAGLRDGVRLSGFDVFDDVMFPLKPGQVLGIIGLTGMGKSLFLKMMFLEQARQIMRDGDTNKVCVFVSVEESVSRIAISFLSNILKIPSHDMEMGKISWDMIKTVGDVGMAKLSGYPIYIMAPLSDPKRTKDGRIKIRMASDGNVTHESVNSFLEYLCNEKDLSISVVGFDFLQILPEFSVGQHEVQRINMNMDWVIGVAQSVGCVSIVASQSKQEFNVIDKYPLDRMASMGSAAFGQRCDQIVTLAYMKNFKEIGEHDSVEGYPGLPMLENETGLWLIHYAKVKGFRDGYTIPLVCHPEFLSYGLSRQYFQSDMADEMNHGYDKEKHSHIV